ncbi:uncharacterized protein LOC133204004 [Saccostrea echinata]|uniref:uncharacterized protein LOC133204004 n=1 Tax=Saccostrea echinata TaxID=191078 RepID=UPI002A7EFB6A|nr:uncharacterized protein LOC133204004 [Saccostrea echinata]
MADVWYLPDMKTCQFPKGLCHEHNKNFLDMFCEDCKVTLCLSCAKANHKDHNWDSIRNIANRIHDNIESEFKEIRDHHLKALEEDLSAVHELEEEEKLQNQFDLIVQTLSNVKDKLLSCLKNHWTKKKEYLENTKGRIEKQREKISKTMCFIKESNLSDSNLVEIYIQLQNLLKQEKYEFSNNAFSIRFLPGELEEFSLEKMIGVSKDVDDFKFDIISSFKLEKSQIEQIHSLTENTAWLYEESRCLLVDQNGTSQDNKQVDCEFGDFTVCSYGNIYFTDLDSKSIRLLTSSGEERLVLETEPLIPTGICWSVVGGLLITLCGDDDPYNPDSTCRRLVRSITLSGRKVKEIEFDAKNNRLFTFPTRVIQNKNTDICVIDMKECDVGEVHILSSSGVSRFVYRGCGINQKNPFCPSACVCDSEHNIIVTDIYNSLIHIIHSDGELLKIIYMQENLEPSCMSICKELHGLGPQVVK